MSERSKIRIEKYPLIDLIFFSCYSDTYGMMSISVDSYEDDTISMYCSFTVTAHDYSGAKIGADKGTIVYDTYNTNISSGDSGDCTFYVNYDDYYIHVKAMSDRSEIPYLFKMTLSVSIFNNASPGSLTETEVPYLSIVKEHDAMVCVPEHRLRDRIVCHNGLKWFEPSWNLDYECASVDNMDSVGDGFCDETNNIDGCWDGGDCCASSCIPSDQYHCENFQCLDDRANTQSMDNGTWIQTTEEIVSTTEEYKGTETGTKKRGNVLRKVPVWVWIVVACVLVVILMFAAGKWRSTEELEQIGGGMKKEYRQKVSYDVVL